MIPKQYMLYIFPPGLRTMSSGGQMILSLIMNWDCNSIPHENRDHFCLSYLRICLLALDVDNEAITSIMINTIAPITEYSTSCFLSKFRDKFPDFSCNEERISLKGFICSVFVVFSFMTCDDCVV